jgi:predicted transport protein
MYISRTILEEKLGIKIKEYSVGYNKETNIMNIKVQPESNIKEIDVSFSLTTEESLFD